MASRFRFPGRIARQATVIRSGVFLFSICLAALGSAPASARTRAATVRVDGDYVSALAAANRFLSAWQNQDREDGLVMLTDAARQGRSEDQLADFFSPGDGAAYEVGRGVKLNVGRYSFPVTLLETKFGHRVRSVASDVIVVRLGRDDWAVDRLP
jgi:hypothetical protein